MATEGVYIRTLNPTYIKHEPHAHTRAHTRTRTHVTRTHVTRPPNAFMIFASKNRKYIRDIVTLCKNSGTLTVELKKFAEQSYVAPQASSSSVKVANIPAEEWLDGLGLGLAGDWRSAKSVPNNIVSKMLARRWNWLNLVKPTEAALYFDAQSEAKATHSRKNPGYKYSPVPRKKEGPRQGTRGARKRQTSNQLNIQVPTTEKKSCMKKKKPVVPTAKKVHAAASMATTELYDCIILRLGSDIFSYAKRESDFSYL